MQTNEIYTAYVSWNGGGKRRPVLVIFDHLTSVKVYLITTKYQKKSTKIKRYYFKINKGQEAGLNRQSYIDTLNQIDLLKKDVNFKYIGNLTLDDRISLFEFIKVNLHNKE